ncbi:MAG TPA: hypothetical protein VK709_16250 [Candidatus Saccharimonadales bacterium]|jgi:hypothetical protein|nr:hypothetical protein [Candidatus Saccharimonadales bacterium]
MNGRENEAELAIISLVIIVLSALGIAAGFSRGLFGGIDGLLALGISLMMILIFSILLLVQAKQQGWIGKHHDGDSAPPAPAK